MHRNQPAGQPEMVERRATPQQTIDARAVEVANRVAGELKGHTDLDSERFLNLQTDISELKSDLKDQGTRQEGYHRDNKNDIAGLKTSVADLAKQVAVDHGAAAGSKLLGASVMDWIKIIIPLVAVGILIWQVTHGK